MMRPVLQANLNYPYTFFPVKGTIIACYPNNS